MAGDGDKASFGIKRGLQDVEAAAACPRAPKVLKVATDFGGMDMPIIALRRLGVKHNHVFSSDCATHCHKFIQHMMKPQIFYNDVRCRDVKTMPSCDVYVWGAPCQPFSSCGLGQGESDSKGRGCLAMCSLKYISVHKPRLTVMENVAGMLRGKHRQTFGKIARALTKLGYAIDWSVVNTQDHGVPQCRKRVWLVAIRLDSIKRVFKWPEAVPLKFTAEEALLPFNPVTDKVAHLPPKDGKHNRARTLVKAAYQKLMTEGTDPKRQLVFTDIDCSVKFASLTTGYLPCMTATRARTCGWWVSLRGRRVVLAELFRFQGLEEEDVAEWANSGISAADMAHMLGNTMSLNVCERILGAALWAAGLVAKPPADRWQA